jgi:hypothetical protein
MFAQAASLHQSGRLKNTIYATGSSVFIFNQDHTVLIKFALRPEEAPFAHPISFDAAEYDSNELQERDGFVEFIQRDAGFTRIKSCRAPKYTPDQIVGIFKGFGKPSGDEVSLSKDVLGLLDGELSHIEFSARGGKLTIAQRNIYRGSLIQLERDKLPGRLGILSEELGDFGPLGLRTDDFMSLFSFADSLTFWFGSGADGNVVHFKSSNDNLKMMGVLSRCVYDNLGGEIAKSKEDI